MEKYAYFSIMNGIDCESRTNVRVMVVPAWASKTEAVKLIMFHLEPDTTDIGEFYTSAEVLDELHDVQNTHGILVMQDHLGILEFFSLEPQTFVAGRTSNGLFETCHPADDVLA